MPKNNRLEWYVQLINGRTGMPLDSANLTFYVLTENDPAEISIYTDDNAGTTATTQPATTTSSGVLRFYTDKDTTAVDISVMTSTGYYFFLESVSESQHRLVVWPEQEGNRCVVPYDFNGASETVVDTGFTLPSSVLVKDCIVHVHSVGTGFNLDVGTSTDPNGFVDGIDASTTGFAELSEIITSAGLLGALISTTTNSSTRKLYHQANATSGASIVYTNTTSSTTAGDGYIYLTIIRAPTG